MMFSVDETFKVLNLIVQALLVAYIMRRYVIGQILQYMHQEKSATVALRQQYTLWREKHAEVTQKMQEEQEAFVVMQEKFAIWDRQVNLAMKQEKAICLQRQKKMDDCFARKVQSIQHRHLIQAELPEIIAQATQDLQKKFKDDKTLGRIYIAKVVDGLQG